MSKIEDVSTQVASSSSDPFSFADDLGIDVGNIIEVEVEVNPLTHFGYLGSAFARDIRRRDVDFYNTIDEQVKSDEVITSAGTKSFEEALILYTQNCVRIRLECISDSDCKNWKRVKYLLLPSTIQEAISSLGKYYDEDTSYLLIPKLAKDVDSGYDMNFMLRVAYYLNAVKTQLKVILHEAAFPTSKYSSSEVMRCTIRKRLPSDGERQVFSVTKLVHSKCAFVAYLLDLVSAKPDWYAVPYGYESRQKELLWRNL